MLPDNVNMKKMLKKDLLALLEDQVKVNKKLLKELDDIQTIKSNEKKVEQQLNTKIFEDIRHLAIDKIGALNIDIDDRGLNKEKYKKVTRERLEYEKHKIISTFVSLGIAHWKKKKKYCIKESYVSRDGYIHYDDLGCEDEWQLEVYLHALGLMKKYGFKKVLDIGCGSGYKLMTYLGDYDTIGLELGMNLEFLKEKYPDRVWLESDFKINHQIDVDVIICSDVIEHIVDPDLLLEYINQMNFKFLVISTPDRDICYEQGSKYHDGPPRNPAHQREWNFEEFGKYASQYFDVIDHRVTNMGQSTQAAICKKYVLDALDTDN